MEFTVFPLVMIALCVVMMLLMMRGMHPDRSVLSSARMGCCGFGFGSGQEHLDGLPSQSWSRQGTTSGNQTFDEYRADTLQRLEQEQRDFQDFLGRLRMAKDKAEFDQFMAERRTEQKSSPPA
jgi:Protein of unknown function (DUF2852)